MRKATTKKEDTVVTFLEGRDIEVSTVKTGYHVSLRGKTHLLRSEIIGNQNRL